MQIEEAIEDIKLSKSTVLFGREQTIVNIEVIETVLNELEKKEAIINEMVEYMEQEMDEYQLDDIYSELHNCNGMERNWTRGKEAEIKDIKEYFTEKAEEK